MHQADEILLHIGFAKTGTTAIQRLLFAHKEELLAQGVLWPGEDDNHYHLRSIISDDAATQIQIRRLGLSDEGVPLFLAEWREKIEAEIRATKPKRILFSTEYLNGAAQHELRRLASFLKQFSPRIRVLAYVRDPWSMAISATQEEVRTGLSPAPVSLAQDVRFNDAIERFKIGLCQELEIRAYQDDVVLNFLEWADISIAYERAPRVNRSMGLYTACLLAELNRHYPAFDETGAFLGDHSRGWMAECIAEAFEDEPPIRMNKRTAAAIEELIRSDLDALRRTYFGGREVFPRNEERFSDDPDDTLHLGRLDTSTATAGLFAAMRGLSDRAIHYFLESQRLRQELEAAKEGASTASPPPPLTPSS